MNVLQTEIYTRRLQLHLYKMGVTKVKLGRYPDCIILTGDLNPRVQFDFKITDNEYEVRFVYLPNNERHTLTTKIDFNRLVQIIEEFREW